jgi:hypothetical protein
MKKQRRKEVLIPQTTDQVASATWVKDMQLFRSKNGFYRPEDLGRVLGDPLDVVSAESSSDLVISSKIPTSRSSQD